MLNMIESRVITKATLETQPLVFYTQHQTAPFPGRIYLPPFADPISGNMHPLMLRWLNLIGMTIAQYLDDHGLPGSMHQETFDVVVSRLHRQHRQFPPHDFVLHGDGAVSLRDAAFLHGRRIPGDAAGAGHGDAVFQPVEGRLVAAGRRLQVHVRSRHGGAESVRRSIASRCSTTNTARRATPSRSSRRSRRSPTRFRASSTTRPRRRC